MFIIRALALATLSANKSFRIYIKMLNRPSYFFPKGWVHPNGKELPSPSHIKMANDAIEVVEIGKSQCNF